MYALGYSLKISRDKTSIIILGRSTYLELTIIKQENAKEILGHNKDVLFATPRVRVTDLEQTRLDEKNGICYQEHLQPN